MNSSCLVDADTSLVLPTIGIYDIYRHILPSGNISCLPPLYYHTLQTNVTSSELGERFVIYTARLAYA